ncbi:hypothetical protein [Micromonospora sp. NPDC049171]|uniref:hypothetical protein n=1 Tax=Micromonospora sp. NPDC049171 TaxID=3155770 RepID=UPI0033E5829B
MAWISVIGAVCGAVIALAGAVTVEAQRNRDERRRNRAAARLGYCLDFAVALDSAHSALREIAQDDNAAPDRLRRANRAVQSADVFAARERLLVAGTVELVQAGELAYQRLIAIRNAIRSGAALSSRDYHRAYHAYAEAIWQLRMAARVDLDQARMHPADLRRRSWSERENCQGCRETTARRVDRQRQSMERRAAGLLAPRHDDPRPACPTVSFMDETDGFRTPRPRGLPGVV